MNPILRFYSLIQTFDVFLEKLESAFNMDLSAHVRTRDYCQIGRVGSRMESLLLWNWCQLILASDPENVFTLLDLG